MWSSFEAFNLEFSGKCLLTPCVLIKKHNFPVIGLINNFNVLPNLLNIKRILNDVILGDIENLFNMLLRLADLQLLVYCISLSYTCSNVLYKVYLLLKQFCTTINFAPISFLKQCLNFWKQPISILIPVSSGYCKVK